VESLRELHGAVPRLVADGVHTYTMPTGAFLEQLNVIVRSKPGDSVIALTSSPDGKLGNLINGTSPIFGGVVPWDQTGGAVAVAPAFSTTKSCVAYACYANDGTANLNIGWVSCTNNGPTQPVSVAGPIVGYPALCYVGDTLWVAYGSSDNLAPQIQQVTIADSGAVTLGTRRVAGNATMGLRISACQQNGTLYLAHANYDDHGNPLYNLCVSMPLSASTSQSYTMYAGLQSSPAIVAVRDDQLPIVAYVDSNDNTLKYVTFNGNAPYPESPFSSPVAVPGQASGDFDATSNPSLAVQLGQTAAGDVIYLAYRQANSGCLMLRTYTSDLLTALDSRVLSGVPIDAPPTVFLALPGGVPLYP
jgi:hypothetical protein